MQRIGIDAGGSLIKLAYVEQSQLHVKTYPYQDKNSFVNWLHMLAPDTHVYGTGGRWEELSKILQQPTVTTAEFPSIVRGTDYLLSKETNVPEEYILVNIGTGTSIFHVNNGEFERVLGSGVGGGTWLGIELLLAGCGKTFRELVELSASGNHYHVDLLVKDIYGEQHAPLTQELTAANFGKIQFLNESSQADQLRALTQLIGEVIISLAATVMNSKDVRKVVFIGSTIQGNKPLRDVLSIFREMLAYEPIFLDKGAYAGAIGSMVE
ncbi:type II pantothenate kinase [Oceanobacillus alkalisoli]|uniref:type II pantothenate kinase n=1 Tax=Oceanobacillus alkalisoli TaxID=2925113 RepID=UPI001F12285E|nr:type II pantothenate kinase [Oceanobacillus alkalisoli]MCF3944398.1 type II pantothenate kinase [Oceanobacillus alkalisoli]